MKFVLATQNPKKLKEMSAILSDLGVEVVSEADLGVKIEVEETGETFAENSLLKAKAVMEATKLPAIADDSGLCVNALNGGPGVYSARYAGEGHDDAANNAKLLDALKDVPGEKRTAQFRTSVALIRRGMPAVTADGSVEGRILHSPQGENGFGYDPLFYYEPLKKSFAQLTPEEKNSVSHRRRALESLCDKLRAEK